MSRRAFASLERDHQLDRLKQNIRVGLFYLTTGLVLSTTALLIVDYLYRPDNFVIQELKIQGQLRHIAPQEIEQVAKDSITGNFFSVDLKSIERELEKIAWIQSAQVRREWPGALLLSIVEQKPVMRWGEDAWVNTKGEVTKLPLGDIQNMVVMLKGNPRDSNLMLHKSVEWQQRFDLYQLQLRKMELSESHAYKLELQEKLREQSFLLYLGRNDVEERLSRFINLYQTQLKNSEQELKRVDARYPDGLAVEFREKPAKQVGVDSESLNQILAFRGSQ